jgi:peptide chain release factor 1
VTDHRINLTLHSIDKIMEGIGLDEIIDQLTAEDQASALAAMQSHGA